MRFPIGKNPININDNIVIFLDKDVISSYSK